MKAVIIIFTLLTALVNKPKTQDFIIEATYVGQEEGVYIFIDEEELEHEFSDIDMEASKKYDLDSEKFVGKKFEVTYWIDSEIDEDEGEYDVYIIVNLNLVN